MDGQTAQDILNALARKLSFDFVRRTSTKHGYELRLVKIKRPTTETCWWPHYRNLVYIPLNGKENTINCRRLRVVSKSSKWTKLLESIVGKRVFAESDGWLGTSQFVDVYGIEQLVVDLELEGYLDKL